MLVGTIQLMIIHVVTKQMSEERCEVGKLG